MSNELCRRGFCNPCHYHACYHARITNPRERGLIKIVASIVKTSKEKITKNGKE